MASIIVLFFVPVLHFSRQNSSSFRVLRQIVFWGIVGKFFILTWIGRQPVEFPFIIIGQAASFFYFFRFLVLLPVAG